MAGQFGLIRSTTSSPDGTTPEDIQRMFAGLISNVASSPMLYGGEVTGRVDLRYNYTAGAGVKSQGAGGVLYTWPAGTTGYTTAPASGTATDTIYVDDYTGPKLVRGAAPAGAIVLGQRTIAAGQTATTSTAPSGSRVQAVSGAIRGASVMEWRSGVPGSLTELPTALTSLTTQTITVPAAGSLRGELSANITSDYGYTGEDLHPGSVMFYVKLDGVEVWKQEVGFDTRWAQALTTFRLDNVTAGTHTVQLLREAWWNYEPYAFPRGETALKLFWEA